MDALDAKVFGLLAVDGAAIAVLVATHSSLNPLWWLPCVGLAVAAVLLLLDVRPREYDQGPNIRAFFAEYGGQEYQVAALQMLGELLAAIERNEGRRSRKVTAKWGGRTVGASSFKIGFLLLVFSIAGAFLVGLAR